MKKRSLKRASAMLLTLLVLFGVILLTSGSASAHVDRTDASGVKMLPKSLQQAQGVVGVIVQLKGQSLAEVFSDSKASGRTMNASAQSLFVSAMLSQQAQVTSQVRALGGSVLGHYTNAYNGLWLNVSADKLGSIAALPQVASISPTSTYRLENGPSVDFIKAPQFWATGGANPIKGQGMKIGIIDTGIDYTHELLGGTGHISDYNTAIGGDGKGTNPPPPALFPNGKVKGGYDFVGYDYNANAAATSIPQPDNNPMDDGGGGGHGTHVAGTAAGLEGTSVLDPNGNQVYGVAPQADLYALKVFGHAGSVSSGVIMQAVEYALDPQGYGSGHPNLANRLDVVNLSIGSDFGEIAGSEVSSLDNAAKVGLIAVVAAGNASSVQYILGTPAISSSAITVAAAVDDAQYAEQLIVNSPANLGPYLMAEGSASTPLTSTPVTGDVVQVVDDGSVTAVTDDACDPITNGASFSGKIVLVRRGICTFQEKVNRILGAGNSTTTTTPVNTNNVLAVIIYDKLAENPFGPSVSAPVPVVLTTQAAGQAIIAALAGGPVNVSLSSPLTIVPGTGGTLANFTSAGPGRGTSTFKPDVSAPGLNIFSSKLGSGTGTLNDSGTSMATPHVTGSVALLRQAHPDWTPTEIKAAIMNTATPTHVSAADPSNNLYSLQGAGLIDVLAAGTTKTIAITKSNQGGIGFGFIELANGKTSVKTQVTVENKDSVDKTYTLASGFINNGGAGMTLSFPATLKVKAGKSATFSVTATFDAATLSQSATRYIEYDGRITLTSGSESVNVPFMATPIVSASIAAKGTKTSLTLTNKSSVAAGPASFYTLGVTDPNETSSTYTGTGGPIKVKSGDAPNNILAIGARTNDAFVSASNFPTGKAFEFAIATSKPVTNPVLSEYDTYISVNGNPVKPDFVAYTIDSAVYFSNGTTAPNGQYIVVVRDLLNNTTVDIESVNQNYNSNVLSFGIPLAALGLTNYQTIQYQTFSYQFFVETAAYGFTDTTSVATFDPTKEAIVTDNTSTRVLDTVVLTSSSAHFNRSGTAPLLITYANNLTGKPEFQVVK